MFTVSEISRILDTTRRKVDFAISEGRVEPVEKYGTTRVFDAAGFERIRKERLRIEKSPARTESELKPL